MITDGQIKSRDLAYANNLLDQYPGSRLFFIQKKTNSEVRQALDEQLKPGDEVAALVLNTHGARNLIASKLGSFWVSLDSPYDVQRTFGPVVGHFKANAKIVSDACNVVEGESPKEALSSLRTIAQVFGLKSGSIYFNKTWGADVRPPSDFSGQNGFQKVILPVLDIVRPVAQLMEYADPTINRGYTLRIQNGKAEVFSDDFFRALGEYGAPKGPAQETQQDTKKDEKSHQLNASPAASNTSGVNRAE